MTKDEIDLVDPGEVGAIDFSSKNLERIRYKLLEQFCQLMQLNTYIHNFGKNAELLIEESMRSNINALRTQLQKKEKLDMTALEKLIENSERSGETLRLLYKQQ